MNENLDEKLKDLLIRLLEDQENVEITVLPPAKAKKEKTAQAVERKDKHNESLEKTPNV